MKIWDSVCVCIRGITWICTILMIYYFYHEKLNISTIIEFRENSDRGDLDARKLFPVKFWPFEFRELNCYCIVFFLVQKIWHFNRHWLVAVLTSQKNWACLKRRHVYEASKPYGRTAEINFGFMSTIVFDGGLRPKLIFFW